MGERGTSMRGIIYKFDDGATTKVAVEDSFFEKYQSLVKGQEKVNRKETRRHYSLEQLLNYGWDREDTKADVAYQLELKEEKARLKEALKKLTKRQRSVLILSVMDKLSFREIGTKLGLHRDTVREYYLLAIKKLKKLLI